MRIAEVWGARGMGEGQSAPELLSSRRVQTTGGLDPLQREVILTDLDHARRPQRAGLGEPGQSLGLGRVLPRAGVRSRLHERRGAVGERDAPRLVDVPAADAPGTGRSRRQAHADSTFRG